MEMQSQLAALGSEVKSVHSKVDTLTTKFDKLDEKMDEKFSQYDKDSAVQALLLKIILPVVGGVTVTAIGVLAFGGG